MTTIKEIKENGRSLQRLKKDIVKERACLEAMWLSCPEFDRSEELTMTRNKVNELNRSIRINDLVLQIQQVIELDAANIELDHLRGLLYTAMKQKPVKTIYTAFPEKINLEPEIVEYLAGEDYIDLSSYTALIKKWFKSHSALHLINVLETSRENDGCERLFCLAELKMDHPEKVAWSIAAKTLDEASGPGLHQHFASVAWETICMSIVKKLQRAATDAIYKYSMGAASAEDLVWNSNYQRSAILSMIAKPVPRGVVTILSHKGLTEPPVEYSSYALSRLKQNPPNLEELLYEELAALEHVKKSCEDRTDPYTPEIHYILEQCRSID